MFFPSYKSAGKATGLYILTLGLLDITREDKNNLNRIAVNMLGM
jgi:hypothetical protein